MLLFRAGFWVPVSCYPGTYTGAVVGIHTSSLLDGSTFDRRILPLEGHLNNIIEQEAAGSP